MTAEINPMPNVESPPRRKRPGLWLLAGVVVAVAAGTTAIVVLTRDGDNAAPSTVAKRHLYQCPMHPTVVMDHPGDCPICGMKLIPIAPEESDHSAHAGARAPDPQAGGHEGHAGMQMPENAAGISGLATVKIEPGRQQMIGLTTAEVERGPIGGAWRTTGRVAVDETRVRHVNIKVPGFVERIYVDFLGKPVKKGEPLFSIYSPELLAAQEELLLAMRTQKRLEGTGGFGSDGDALVAASYRKLDLWDIPKIEIDRMLSTGRPLKTLTIYSPISGAVTKKDVVQGMRLDAGAMPYEVTDLSEVWVLADVYESELGHVEIGMDADLVLKAFPNKTFRGKATFIDPILDPATRTAKVRLTFPNPTGELRPGMFGEVVLLGASREALRIPADAVIPSGTQSYVFVSLGEGKFEPREVKLGESDGKFVELISGVSAGEQVIGRANFLVDSESRLRASLDALRGAGEHAGHGR